MDQIGAALRDKRGPHTVALVSTVLPGSSDRTIIPRLEAASQRRLGDGLGYCYNPVFIALGEVVKGFEVPDYLLIGEADAATGAQVIRAHATMLKNRAPVARMRPIEAEVTKLASNTHETMRVAFANMLFCACSEIPGADVDRITEALTHRMGRRFFKGATPFGGPCWPRDNQALAAFMNAIGTPSGMPGAVDDFNDEHGRYILRTVLSATAPGDVVGILGLSYKPGTSCVERAYGIDLAIWLADEGRQVVAWDPLAMNEARRVTHGKLQFARSAEDCLAASSLAVIVNPLADAEGLNWSAAHRTVVLDCWRSLPASAIACIGSYRPLGRGPQEPISAWLDGHIGERLRILSE
jgi:UDPglucose 6-dehydrogenase